MAALPRRPPGLEAVPRRRGLHRADHHDHGGTAVDIHHTPDFAVYVYPGDHIAVVATPFDDATPLDNTRARDAAIDRLLDHIDPERLNAALDRRVAAVKRPAAGIVVRGADSGAVQPADVSDVGDVRQPACDCLHRLLRFLNSSPPRDVDLADFLLTEGTIRRFVAQDGV